jgi:phage protein D
MTYRSTFQDRAAQAAEAKQKALEQYRARPPVDESEAAERFAAGEQRAEAKAEKAAAKKADRKAADEAAAADAAAKAAASAPKSEAELKAARDARYAKRKARK